MSIKTLPAALPGGELLPYMQGQRLNQLAWTVFEAVGGFQKLVHVVEKNDENYKWFVKDVLVKTTPKQVSLDTAASGIESLLKKAQVARDEGIIDITPTEVEDAD